MLVVQKVKGLASEALKNGYELLSLLTLKASFAIPIITKLPEFDQLNFLSSASTWEFLKDAQVSKQLKWRCVFKIFR